MPAATESRPRAVRRGFDDIASLLEYPQGTFADTLDRAIEAVREACPGAAEQLLPLRAHAALATLHKSQELYVRTFDLNPVCALEVGWQMYGERYARGTFLVRMRELAREFGLPESTELPDHLGNVLRVAARADDPTAAKLARSFALPALGKMQAAFGSGESGDRNPYASLLDAAVALLRTLAAEAGEEPTDV